MKRWAFIICITFILASCNDLLKSTPSGTLTESQMVDVLVDIHLTEAVIRVANDSIGRLHDTVDLQIRFAQVFKKHDIMPNEFNKSLKFYLEHIDELDKIYSEVIARLTELETRYQPLATDSLATAQNKSSKDTIVNHNVNVWYQTLIENTGNTYYFDILNDADSASK